MKVKIFLKAILSLFSNKTDPTIASEFHSLERFVAVQIGFLIY